MKLYRAKLKSRKQIMAEIPREQQGWWADVCAGETLTLRDATAADVARCSINEGQSRDPADYLCEACERGSLVRRIAIKELTEIPDRRAAPPSPSTAAGYGPVHVVSDLVRNLLTLDQSAPIFAAFHLDIDGQRRCRTRSIHTSWERVVDGKWVDSARVDVPYSVIVWAKPDERAATLPSPSTARDQGAVRDGQKTVETRMDAGSRPLPEGGPNSHSTAPRVWIKHLTGADCKPDGRCYDIAFAPIPGYTEYSANPPSTASELPPIEYDHDMDRTYIPLPGGWEIQTKGKGSTFRIAHIPSRTRWMVLDDKLHEPLEALARDVRVALATKEKA